MKARDFTQSGFADTSFVDAEDADPRVGLVNLADVMLVFACGLMVALVVNWNIKLPSAVEVSDVGEMSELSQDEINDMAQDMLSDTGTGYQEKGIVYEDPTTKQLYMLEQTDESDTDDGSGDAGSTSGSASASGTSGSASTDSTSGAGESTAAASSAR